MKADNNFTIGATFDKSQLDASMAEGAQAINQIPQQFEIAFKEVSKTTTRALREISEETKAAAAVIGQDWIEVAAATQEYTAAQREVRAASKLTADTSLNEAASLSVLAAAKHRAAAAAMDLRAAEQAAIGTQELEEASNTTLAESFAVLSERMNLKNAMGGAVAGGLSSAFGAAMGVSILGEYVNHLKDATLSAQLLSQATGISVQSLVELQNAFKSQGVPMERFSATMSRLAEHMSMAREGNSEEVKSFKQLGFSADDLKSKHLSLEDVLMRIARHLENSKQKNQDLSAAYILLGRGSDKLVAALERGPAALKKQMQAYSGVGAATQKAVVDAEKLQQVETDLAAKLDSMLLPVLGQVVQGYELVASVGVYVEDGVKIIGKAIAGVFLMTFDTVRTEMTAVNDVLHGHFSKAADDIRGIGETVSEDWGAAMTSMESNAQDAADRIAKIMSSPPPIPPVGGVDNGGAFGGKGPSANALRSQKLQAMEQELADEQTKHSVSLGEELQFWASKESIFKAGTAQRLAIDKKIATLDEDLRKSALSNRKRMADDWTNAYKTSQEKLTADLAKNLEMRTAAFAASLRDQSAAQQEYAAGLAAHGMAALELARQEVEQRRQLGQESARNAIADLQQIAAAEHDLRMKTLQAKLSDDQALQAAGIPNRAAVQADLNAIQAEQDNFRAKISGFHAQIAEESKRTWDAIGQTINRAFSESIQGVIQGTQSVSQAFAKMEVSILASTIQTLEQMATRYLLHEAQMTVMHAAGVEHRVATTAAGAAQEKSIGLMAMMEHITREAARTAASTFRSVMSTVPFPANAILAPIEAGAAFAGVEAFGALASARGGQWDVPQPEQLTLLHAKEMVLPAQYAEPLRQTVTAGKGMRGGDIHLHIQAVDAKSFETMLSDNSSALVRTLRKAHRSGMLTGRVS